jgi:hypothetical protein
MPRTYIRIAIGIVVVQAVLLYLFGQPPICTCGYIKLWEGVVLSPGNSQHLSDWYSFSHIIHGFIFYAALSYFLPRLSIWQRFALAVGIEAAWEVIENTPMVIQHYREQALAQGYTGDSILNSVSDTLMMMAGFIAANKFAGWSIVLAALAMEIFTAYMIRDNLTLNILNLIHVFPQISAWQAAAGVQ